MQNNIISIKKLYTYTSKKGNPVTNEIFVNICGECLNPIHKITYNHESKTYSRYPNYCPWCGCRFKNSATFKGGNYEKFNKDRRK